MTFTSQAKSVELKCVVLRHIVALLVALLVHPKKFKTVQTQTLIQIDTKLLQMHTEMCFSTYSTTVHTAPEI